MAKKGKKKGTALATTTRGGSMKGRAAALVKERTKHSAWAVGAATALGLLKASGVKLPTIAALPPEVVYGGAALLATVLTNSKPLAHAATGLLSVAGHTLALKYGKKTGVAGDDDMLEGDDDDDTIMGDVEIVE